MLGAHLTAENLKAEADYFARKESKKMAYPAANLTPQIAPTPGAHPERSMALGRDAVPLDVFNVLDQGSHKARRWRKPDFEPSVPP